MNSFSLFSAKVLVSAAVAFLPMLLLLTGFEMTTEQVARQAQMNVQAQVLAHGAASSGHGVVVG